MGSKMGRPRKDENILARWIDRTEKGDREKVAKDLGISREYLDRLCRGERRPSLALALTIEAKTGIKVGQWADVAPHSAD
jgi:transcriptional regulator with XRE-family HTH domain